ncbi:hypothetical protein [Methanosarcina siciliae]|nr:hypothetical protein [Methanosarcina siciliae]
MLFTCRIMRGFSELPILFSSGLLKTGSISSGISNLILGFIFVLVPILGLVTVTGTGGNRTGLTGFILIAVLKLGLILILVPILSLVTVAGAGGNSAGLTGFILIAVFKLGLISVPQLVGCRSTCCEQSQQHQDN